MNLTPMPIVDAKSDRKPQVAVLVDGENISSSHAEAIMKQARLQGVPCVRRVYGNVAKLPGWDAEPGLDMIHTGSGKNAADIKLCIDAVDMAARGMAERFVIVSSDSDFSHIARHLRERGFAVTGMGMATAGDTFKCACGKFIDLEPTKEPKPVKPPVKAKLAMTPLEAKVCKILDEQGVNGSMEVHLLGVKMKTDHDISTSSLPSKNWTQFLRQRTLLFDCDPKGPNTRVRLATG